MKNSPANPSTQENFLDLLDVLLKRGYFAYQEYMKFDKKFHYTKRIKENNEDIVRLIKNHEYLFDGLQRSDLLQIVLHLESWKAQWNFLYQNSHPDLDDQFIFDTLIKFPKDSLRRLNEFYCVNFDKEFTQ